MTKTSDAPIGFQSTTGISSVAAGDSPPVNIPVGDIQFFDNFMPPLVDGKYKLTVTQDIIDPNTKQSLPGQPYTQAQYFEVQGPRFKLDPTLVYSTYPPPNSLADYRGVMPHIVLGHRTLPWERTLDGELPASPGDVNYPNQPWLALLLFDEDEIICDSAVSPSNTTRTSFRQLSEVINLPAAGAILGPQITSGLDPTTPLTSTCLTIDVARDTFLAIAPQARELPFLAHCREVNTGDKEILGINADGWFSVVIANRVPDCPAVSAPGAGQRNLVHLVSLEGLQDYLPGGPEQIPQNIQSVRIVSLASWFFTCASNGLDFRDLMQALKIGTLQLPADASPPNISPPALPNIPASSSTSPAQDAASLVQNAWEQGFVPLNYTTLQGEQSMGWCRGPFLPSPLQRVEREPFGSADEAKIYDPNTGLFDMSYAVAWQIGRLLALADKEFSVTLLRWQQEVNYLINLIIEQQQQAKKFGNLLSIVSPSDALQSVAGTKLLNKKPMFRAVVSYLKTNFAAKVLPVEAEMSPLLGEGRDPTGIRRIHPQLPGLLSESEMDELLETGDDPARALGRNILRS
ncbi:MAG: hypothetical protein QOD75_1892 [Blastocatellia bacterium]|jgi:hypothetical protein|nr:hypothetical protein [Blastocatellia bacterium]